MATPAYVTLMRTDWFALAATLWKMNKANGTPIGCTVPLSGNIIHYSETWRYWWWHYPIYRGENLITKTSSSHLLTLKALPRQWVALELPISSPCCRECWRPSVHSSWYLSWWYPCISISVFLSVSHLLPPCPTLFWLYGFNLYIWHVHTSVVASASGVLLSAGLLLLPWSLRFFCALSG